MSTCAKCSAELRPEWNFCVYCGTTTVPGAVRPESPDTQRVNPLAILALVLACVGGFPALIFGHIAMRQIRDHGGQGLLIARIATVLGYVWLALGAVLLVSWIRGSA